MKKSLGPLLEKYFDSSMIIPVTKIPFDNEVRKLCEQNMCGKFGKNWTCPPAVGTLEQLHEKLTGFDRFFIFYKVYALEDSFDWEGMMDSVKDFQSRIMKLRNKIEKELPDFDYLVLGAGSCQICETCTYLEKEPCRLPEKALFSVESFGVDVMKMMNENGLKYNNGANTVTYIGGIFYQKG